MVRSGTERWRPLERWSPLAFVFAGVLWFGDTLLLGLELFRIFPSGVINSGLVLTGLLCSLLGMIGLNGRLAARAPRLALASTVVVVLGGAAIAVQILWGLAAILVSAITNPPGITTLMIGVLVLGGFVSVGITSLYTGVHSPLVGVLFFTYAITIVGAAVATDWVQLGLVVVLGTISIAIGYLLHTNSTSNRSNPSTDTTS